MRSQTDRTVNLRNRTFLYVVDSYRETHFIETILITVNRIYIINVVVMGWVFWVTKKQHCVKLIIVI